MASAADTGQLEALFTEVNSLAIHFRGGLGSAGGEEGFTGGVSGVLKALGGDGPHTVPGVARVRRTSRQNIQIVVNRLRKAGLVEIESNPAHKRSALIRLTEKGKVVLGQIQEAESGRRESIFAQIPEEDVACTRRVLSQIRQSLGGEGGNKIVQEPAKLQRPRPSAEPKAKARRPRYAKLPVVEESTADEEVFPLNLL